MIKQAGKETSPICICPTCPTFVDCKGKKAFCLIGKSVDCIKVAKECFCQKGCPVALKYGFKKWYYCLKGSDKELK